MKRTKILFFTVILLFFSALSGFAENKTGQNSLFSFVPKDANLLVYLNLEELKGLPVLTALKNAQTAFYYPIKLSEDKAASQNLDLYTEIQPEMLACAKINPGKSPDEILPILLIQKTKLNQQRFFDYLKDTSGTFNLRKINGLSCAVVTEKPDALLYSQRYSVTSACTFPSPGIVLCSELNYFESFLKEDKGLSPAMRELLARAPSNIPMLILLAGTEKSNEHTVNPNEPFSAMESAMISINFEGKERNDLVLHADFKFRDEKKAGLFAVFLRNRINQLATGLQQNFSVETATDFLKRTTLEEKSTTLRLTAVIPGILLEKAVAILPKTEPFPDLSELEHSVISQKNEK